MKNNGSEAEFFESVQVYPEDLLRVQVHQSGRFAQGLLNTEEKNKFLRCGRPKFYFGGISSTLLATKRCFLEERSLEGLKRCSKLCIEVDIALQVARQAQVVFQGSQDDGLGKEFYGPEFLVKGSQAEEINLLDKEHYVRVVKI